MVRKLLITVLMVFIMAFSASAFTVTNSNDETISVIGDNDNDDITGTVTITNDEEIDNISVTCVTKIVFDDFNATVRFNQSTVNITPGNSTTVTYYFRIPEDIAGEQKGYINFTNGTTTNGANITLDVSQLELSDLDVKVGGSYDKNIQGEDDGYEIDVEAEPGDTVVFELEFKNLYSGDNDADIDIEDIAITITIEDLDDGDDLEEDIDEFDIRYDDEESVSVTFEVPIKAVSDAYTVVIEVEAEDEDSNDFGFEKEYELVVEREKHKILIENVYFTYPTISCDRETTLKVDIINIGEKYEDDVMVTIKNDDLGIDKKEIGIELDEDPDDDDNELMVTFPLSIGDNIAAGSYLFDVRSSYDDRVSDVTKVQLVISKCIPPVVEEEEDEVVIETQPDSGIETGEEAEAVPITVTGSEPIQESFRDSGWFIALLIIVNIAIIGAAIWLIIKFLVK